MNLATSFLDASDIYGSSHDAMKTFRILEGGQVTLEACKVYVEKVGQIYFTKCIIIYVEYGKISVLTKTFNIEIIAKEAFNRKILLFTSKLNIELKKKLVRCYV